MQAYIPPLPESLPSAPIKATARSTKSAHHLIRGYIKSESSREFQLIVSEVIVRKIANLFLEIVEHYVITFCPSTSILLIVPMTQVHNIISFLHYSTTEWVGSGFLTADIYNHIQLMRLATKLPQANRKKLVWKKGPDCVLGFGTLGQKLIPRVAVEVSFSQPYEDLITDVCKRLRWEKRLTIAILVKDVRVLREIQSSERFQHRARGLLSLYGNTAGQENSWIDVEESVAQSESDETLYDDIDRSITDTDWVGPLTATIEIWCRNSDGVPTCREGPIAVLPAPEANPTIQITDLVPEEFQGQFPDFDRLRETQLDMEAYKSTMEMATHALALDRALGYLKPRPRGNGDSD